MRLRWSIGWLALIAACTPGPSAERDVSGIYALAVKVATLSDPQSFVVDTRVIASGMNGMLSTGTRPEDIYDLPDASAAIRAGAEALDPGPAVCEAKTHGVVCAPSAFGVNAVVAFSEVRWVTDHLVRLPLAVVDAGGSEAYYMAELARSLDKWYVDSWRYVGSGSGSGPSGVGGGQ